MNGFPPIPASAMLLTHLLGLVFIVHIVFMNYVVAAPLVSTWYLLVKGEKGRQRALWMINVLPVAVTFAINFGVAALLFVQALFAEKFFTANILLGSFWLSVIGFLMIAFYGIYIAKRMAQLDDRNPRWAGVVLLAVNAMIWYIGIVMISNYFVTTEQENWMTLRSSPLNVLSSESFLPRSLHFLTGSFAVTGFWMMWTAWFRSRRGENHYDIVKLFKQGASLAAVATSLQVVIGIWLVFALTPDVWDRLLSGSFPSVVWISGVASGLLLLGSLLIINFNLGRFFWLKIATGLLLYTLIGMVAGRDLVRLASMNVTLTDLQSRPQGGAILIFSILLLVGLATMAWLIWILQRVPPKGNVE